MKRKERKKNKNVSNYKSKKQRTLTTTTITTNQQIDESREFMIKPLFIQGSKERKEEKEKRVRKEFFMREYSEQGRGLLVEKFHSS